MIRTIRILEQIGFILCAIVTAIFAVAIIVIPFDIYSFFTEPSAYIRVYHLNPEEENWKWNYLKGPVLLIGIALAVIAFFIYSFRHNSSFRIRLIRHFLVLLLWGFMIYGFYSWYLTGFNH